MEKMTAIFKLNKAKEQIDESIKELVSDGCVCESGLDPRKDRCVKNKIKWECRKCGASLTILDCDSNHMFYDCPFCGTHLT